MCKGIRWIKIPSSRLQFSEVALIGLLLWINHWSFFTPAVAEKKFWQKRFMCRKKSIIVFLCIQYVNISCTTSESTMKFFDHTFFSLLIAPHFEICIISKEVIRVSARTIKINLIPNWDKYLSTNSKALKN